MFPWKMWMSGQTMARSLKSREAIRQVYRNASEAFQKHHASRSEDGRRYHDHMLFGIAIGVKKA